MGIPGVGDAGRPAAAPLGFGHLDLLLPGASGDGAVRFGNFLLWELTPYLSFNLGFLAQHREH